MLAADLVLGQGADPDWAGGHPIGPVRRSLLLAGQSTGALTPGKNGVATALALQASTASIGRLNRPASAIMCWSDTEERQPWPKHGIVNCDFACNDKPRPMRGPHGHAATTNHDAATGPRNNCKTAPIAASRLVELPDYH